ncbi:MAG: AAA family ATPase [Ideonella sp.]|nr:AAA family ATPase [Ideonella sp.]MCC7458549.1 AAA family ATPase [Nitrospira sp.]
MHGPLELELLGSARVRVGGEPVALPTRKAFALLAYLALAGAQPRRVVAELLWSGTPEDARRSNLRQELHRLQRTPLAAWLEVSGDQLALREGIALDVSRWRLAVEGAAGEVVAAPPPPLLDGFALHAADDFMSWLQAQRDLLLQTWRQAVRRQATMREEAGDPHGALELLRGALASETTNEELHREAMRLLHQLGDAGGATELFERLQRRLRDELDAEPQAQTMALWQRIRFTPGGCSAAPGVAPDALQAPLIGRETAWQQLEAASGSLALIEGEAGVGKSRLALDFGRARGLVVLLKGREVSRETPLYPVADALLRAYQDDTGWFELLDPAWRIEVARLLPALADDNVAPIELPLVEARARFLEGLTAALLTAAGSGTIVFDDIQWLDAATAELMAHVARRPPRARLIATVRSDELSAGAGAASALEAIARDGLLQRVVLAPLTEPQVLGLVRALSGSREAARFSHRLHAVTAGNPLFIFESLHDLFDAGVLWRAGDTWATPFDDHTEDYRELPLSPSVREAVLRRIDRLGEATRRLLDAASLAGDGFRLDWLLACTEYPEETIVEAADGACRAGLIADTGFGFRFTHDLIRRSLDEALGSERRKLMHRRLAEAMARTGAAPADVAAHLEAGQRAPQAVSHRVRAAEAAARVYALHDALTQYGLALADGMADAAAFDAHSARVELLRNLGDNAGRSDALAAMAELVTSDDVARQVELAVKQAVDHFEHQRYEEAWRTASEAIVRLRGRLDEVTEAALLLEAGAALKALGRLDEAETALSTALARYRPISPLKTANCSYWLCQCAIERGDIARAHALCEESIAATAAAGHRRGHALSLATRADMAFRAGDVAAGAAALEQAYAEAREIGSLPLQRAFAQRLVERLGAAGAAERAAAWQTQLARLQER